MSKSSSHHPVKEKSDKIRHHSVVDNMPVINNHAAGIDLAGASSHYVAVEVDNTVVIREFGGVTDEVKELVNFLVNSKVTSVAMESTGVYWKIVYDLIEKAGITVYLVNPTHVKNVPGRRKDDKSDSCWIQKLHKFGLLSASFRPQLSDRAAHDLYRQRVRLVRMSSDEIRRMQKALDVMNIRIHKVVSDLSGLTGMKIIRAIINGERDPENLVKLRDKLCAHSIEEFKAALTGYYTPQNILELKQALQRYDLCEEQIIEIDKEIEEILRSLIPLDDVFINAEIANAPKPQKHHRHEPNFDFMAYHRLLVGKNATVIPGIGIQSLMGLHCELGRDFSKWETAKHFTSYLTLAPVKKISGGKLLSSSTRAGIHPAGSIFKQAAAAVIRTDTALSWYYKKLAVRIGKGKAQTAIARKLAIKYFNLMKYNEDYVEIGNEEYEKMYHQNQINRVKKMAKKYGLTVTETTPANP